MPSVARAGLEIRLKDADELIVAHAALTGGRRGRPARRQGAAVVRAGVVLVVAAMEAFVEDLFEEAASLLFPAMAPDDLKALFRQTSERLNNADALKTNLLFFNLGIPWILASVRWQKTSNGAFKKRLHDLIQTRGQIAHGRAPTVSLAKLRGWRQMVGLYASVLDRLIADQLSRLTGTRPNW